MMRIPYFPLFFLVLTSFVAACSGQSSRTAVPTVDTSQSIAAVVPNAVTVVASPGVTNGVDPGWTPYAPADGDRATGGNGTNVVNGVPCGNTPTSNTVFHARTFLGFIVNGQEKALPDSIGVIGPVDTSNYITQFRCAYYLSTRDQSGVVHIDTPSGAATSYDLPTIVHIWGIYFTRQRIGPYSGPVTVYIGHPNSSGVVTSYALYTGLLPNIPLTNHTATWFVVGNKPASGIPDVKWTYTK